MVKRQEIIPKAYREESPGMQKIRVFADKMGGSISSLLYITSVSPCW